MRSRIITSLLLLTIGLGAWTCTFTEKIKDGRSAYERKRYFQAAEMLQGEFNQARTSIDRMNIAYLIGESSMQFGDFEQAAEWYRIAYDGGYGVSALVAYAGAQKQMERYKEAAAAYTLASQELNDNNRFRSEVASCVQAATWKTDIQYSPYVIENLDINSPSSDYAPVPIGTDEIAFTSDRAASTGDFTYAWSGNDFSDIFVMNTRNNEVKPFGHDGVNLENNEGTLVKSPDGKQIVFCRCMSREDYDEHCKLFISHVENNSWTRPVIMSFVKDGINYRHPAFNRDGTMLIFSANIDEATNDYDLYVSRLEEDRWQQPVTLGGMINTQGREGFPYMIEDTLYFATDSKGMGGLDIYKTHLNARGQWVSPENMKAPINSGADDFAFVIDTFFSASDSVLFQAYFSSNRLGGRGGDDIYRVERRKHFEKKPEPELNLVYEIMLDLRTVQREYEDPSDPNSKVIQRRPLPNSGLTVTEDGQIFTQTATNRFGIKTLQLNFDRDYKFIASHDGFFNNEITFSTKDLEIVDSTRKIQRYDASVLLDRIFYGTEIVLENIYYDLDESYIRDDAKPTLDTLANMLRFNPGIRIQLSSHTDCRAPDDYNLNLSQARAQSAVNYLIEKGVAEQRLVAVGYGETQLAIDCNCDDCTEEEHQVNRRTTFKVVQ